MNYRASLLNKLRQHAANAATPQVTVEPQAPATVAIETPEVVVQIEPQPASTPVVAEVQKATPVVAKPQPEPQPKETASYKKVETGKKVLPKTMKDLKDLKSAMGLPMFGLIKIAEYVPYENTVVINSMAASTENGRKNVVPLNNEVAKAIVEILEGGKTAFVTIVSKGEVHIVTQVIGETDTATIEGKIFTGVQQVNQWIINQMIQSKIEITEATVNAAMNMLLIVNVGNGLVVVNKNTVIAATGANALNSGTTAIVTSANATATAATTEGVATGVATTTVATTATTTGK